jgi:hypothetical protein
MIGGKSGLRSATINVKAERSVRLARSLAILDHAPAIAGPADCSASAASAHT